MLDLCDSEMIESFKYLIVSKEEKCRVESRSFDGKKNCWVPDLKDCFVAAEILSEEDDLVTVLTLHDEVDCSYNCKPGPKTTKRFSCFSICRQCVLKSMMCRK